MNAATKIMAAVERILPTEGAAGLSSFDVMRRIGPPQPTHTLVATALRHLTEEGRAVSRGNSTAKLYWRAPE